MATIVVNSLSDVLVDGVASGSVTDVLTNYKNAVGIRGSLLNAIQDWHQGQRQDNDAVVAAIRSACDDEAASMRAAHAGEIAAMGATHADEVASLRAAHAGEVAAIQADHAESMKTLRADHAGEIRDLGVQIQDLKGQIDALGGTELAKQLAREAQRKAALDRIEAAKAELAAMDETSTPDAVSP